VRPPKNCVQQTIPIPEEGNLKNWCRQPFRSPSCLGVQAISHGVERLRGCAAYSALDQGPQRRANRGSLEYSRNAVCAKLTRLGLKGGHMPPTANSTIRPVPKRRPALLAACARPVEKVVSQKRVTRQPKEFTKRPGEWRETK
jgi:hypothetical protein